MLRTSESSRTSFRISLVVLAIFLQNIWRFQIIAVSLCRLSGHILSKINEALCSSCILKPRKFHIRQENMMASMRKRGLPAISLLQGFLRPQDGEVDTVPRFMHNYNIEADSWDWRRHNDFL